MPTTRRPLTRLVGLAGAGVLLALATACGGTGHSEADVAFAQDMLVHHAQALDMVEMTEGRPLDPEVQRLAGRIQDAQEPEIGRFTTWLRDWGENVPDASGGMGAMDHDMPGMMSGDDMRALDEAPDEFRSRWLEMMVEHHEGAVAMAEQEIEEGEHEPSVDLARDIVRSQTSEVETMRRLLRD